MWRFITALLSGALMNIQGIFNMEVTKQTSIWMSAGLVQLTASFTCAIMQLVIGQNEVGGLLRTQPWYTLAGGVTDVLITYTVTKSVGTLGPAKSALIIMIAQIIVAYGVEVFELFGMDKVDFE